MSYQLQPIVVGNTHDFVANFQKDGSTWNITGGTISLYLIKPNGVVLPPFSATITSGSGGVAHYAAAATVLDVPGEWKKLWYVSVSGVVQRSTKIPFMVYDSEG